MAQGLLATIVLALALAASARAEVLSTILQPNWTQLTPLQKQILAPLQSDWDGLDDSRRRRWLRIAERYPRMPAQEQQRVQTRMKQWTDLTPEQRRKAREHYQHLQNIAPSQREGLKEKWQEYESLPEAEKERLKGIGKQRRYGHGSAPRGRDSGPGQAKKKSAPPPSESTAHSSQVGVPTSETASQPADADESSPVEAGMNSPRGSPHEDLAIPRR